MPGSSRLHNRGLWWFGTDFLVCMLDRLFVPSHYVIRSPLYRSLLHFFLSLYLLHVLTAFSYMWYIRMVCANEPSVAKMFRCRSDASSCFIVFCLRSAFSTRKLYVCTVGCRNCMRVRQKDVRSNVPSLVKLLQCLRKRILLDEITLVVTQWFNNTILPGTIK